MEQAQTEIEQRQDGNWIVYAKLSAVRIGLENKELVKNGNRIDYRKWITCFVSKTQTACIEWQKNNKTRLDRLSQKYSVNVKQYRESTS